MKSLIDEDYIEAVRLAKLEFPNHLVDYMGSYIVLGVNERDLQSKLNRIRRGDNNGFYTVFYFLNKNKQI